MSNKKERHLYNRQLIKKIVSRKKKRDYKVVDIAQEYCDTVGIEYTENVRKGINKIIVQLNLKSGRLKPSESPEFLKASKKKISSKKKTYFVSWAQAHTPIHDEVFFGMKKLAEVYDAEILIIPGTYLNPWNPYKDIDTTWDDRLVPYLISGQCKLHKYLSIIGDADILPTAKRPLRGLQGVTGKETSIIGHPRQHIEPVATLPNQKDKLMMSTGAITIPNYRRSRVGKEATFHHQVGFLVVEVFNNTEFVVRHVSANKKTGHFQDLNYTWRGKEIKQDGDVGAIIYGDLHLSKEEKSMLEDTDKIAKKLKVENCVLHDLADGHSVNPHAKNDYVHKVVNFKNGGGEIDKEIDYMIDFLRDISKKYKKSYVVSSNHNDWLDRYVRTNQGTKDFVNAIKFNEYQNVLFNEQAPKGLVAYEIDKVFKGKNVITLHRNDSLEICGHELNNHGDLGANGSRGSKNIYATLNVKIVSGHSHSLYTLDGAYGVGITTTKDHGYNQGLSSWTQSHGIVNGMNKYQHLMWAKKARKFTNQL